ncbi:MAG: WG repeat-containing protein [Bacilli bacterium]|nr:WG repeat-containing protein [Bacilli bacterium]
MNCPKCNAVNNQDARFCGSCGYDLQSAPQENINNEEVEEILEVDEPAQPEMQQPIMQETQVEQPVMQQPVMEQPTMQPVNQQYNQIPQQPGLNPQNKPKKSKAPLIIIGALVAVAAIIVCVILLLNLNPSEEKLEKDKIDAIFNPEQLIKVKKDDKYGFIDTEGNVKISTKYEYATDFKGKYAVVRSEVETDGLTKTVYQIIDNKGKVQKEAKTKIEYIEENDSWIIDEELYNNKMKKISPEGVRVDHKEDKYYLWVNSKENTGGLMNEKGKQIYTYNFKSGETSIYVTIPSIDESQKERYCVVNVERKYGVINCDTGVVVREMAEERISSNTDNIFTVKDSSYDFKEKFYVQNDKVMYSTTNEEMSVYYYPGYLSLRDGTVTDWRDRYSYFDLKTGEVVKEQPSSTDEDDKEDEEDLNSWEKETNNKYFTCSDGYGLMNNDVITLPCQWDSLEYLDLDLYKYLKANKKDYIYGKNDGKWYLIDLAQKKAIVEFNTSYLTKREQTTFIYYTDDASDTRKVYNLLSNKSLSIDKDKTLTVNSNYITVKDTEANSLKYYNTDLKMIYEGDI